MLLVFVAAFSSCEKVDYKEMNITNYEEEIDIKEFVGDLTGHIIIKDVEGNTFDNIDMGQTFYVVDNTEGGATDREWNISLGDFSVTSKEQFVRLNIPVDGDLKISLTSTRSSDGKTVTSEETIKVNFVPVAVDFISNPGEEGGVVNSYGGHDITFTTIVSGAPSDFEWKFEGPVTITSTEQDPVVKFTELGMYDLTLTAKRSDGEQVVISKPAYINVEKLVINLIRSVATDNKIALQFDKPIDQNIPADAASEFSIVINTAAGASLTPDVISFKAVSDSVAEIAFADKMYSDDEVLLSFSPSGLFKDATGLVSPEAFTDPCVYGYNLWLNADCEDQSKIVRGNNTLDTDGVFAFVDAEHADYPMEPYQGNTCMVIVKGGDKVSASVVQGFTVAEGDVIEFAYEARSVEAIDGAMERRMSLVSADGSNAAGGNWMSAGDNGKGQDKWMKVSKQITVGTDTKAQSGELFFHFLRYGGTNDTGAIWIDNLRIYYPNPRP